MPLKTFKAIKKYLNLEMSWFNGVLKILNLMIKLLMAY